MTNNFIINNINPKTEQQIKKEIEVIFKKFLNTPLKLLFISKKFYVFVIFMTIITTIIFSIFLPLCITVACDLIIDIPKNIFFIIFAFITFIFIISFSFLFFLIYFQKNIRKKLMVIF